MFQSTRWERHSDGGAVVKPRLLEVGACEGGMTVGYMRAGWEVTAVDTNAARLKYNPADERVVGDGIAYMAVHGRRFDAVHISPPCQWYTRGRAAHRGKPTKWERSIPTFRKAAQETGLPYVLENVKDAGWDMLEPVTLCGCMFGLSVVDYTCTAPPEDRAAHALSGACDLRNGVRIHLQRPRLFETSWGLQPPRPCDHSGHQWVGGAYGGARRDKHEARFVRRGGYVPHDKALLSALLGVSHEMTWEGLFECVPPSYAEHVGRSMLEVL